MRTTLTIDEDVAVQLEQALRRGLRDMSGPPRKRRTVRTGAFPMGKPLISADNVAEALAHLEGEAFK